MIKTPVCELLGIETPIVLGGMAGATAAPLVTAVSNAGGLGTLGLGRLSASQITEGIQAIRAATSKPFAVNFLAFLMSEDQFAAALAEAPPVMAFAWASPEQPLGEYYERAKAAGSLVMHMAGTVEEAARAAESGADVIVAQGSEGGGHVGWMNTMPLVPMVVDAVAPIPVLAAGGIADGRGLAAALALGADGVLIGTRFLATEESPLHPNFKAAILHSDGHDTLLTEIPDVAAGRVWPGAMARHLRNRFIERWAGQEWALRQQQKAVAKKLDDARNAGDADNGIVYMSQDAGLISEILPAGEVIRRMTEEAAAIISGRLAGLGKPS